MVNEGHAKRLSIGGALLAALAASWCCLGPLLLAALGVGGAGATATLGAFRPYHLAGTALLLGAGFFFAYRKPRKSAADACGCEKPRVNRVGRFGLWIGTLLVVLVAAAPALLAKWSNTRTSPASVDDAKLAKATIDVQGIDCEACAAPIRKALTRVGGLRDLDLDVAKQAVRVTYEPASGRLAAYVVAINDLGYEAKLLGGGEARR